MRDESWMHKLNRGRWVEKQILLWYRENVDPKAKFPHGHTPDWDIESPEVGNIEVKEDLMAIHTGNYALEFENYEGKPSGYMGTKAKEFVLVDHDWVIRMSTDSLKYIMSKIPYKKVINMGFTEDNGKTCKGYLVQRDVILNSPYIEKMERWFPWKW